MSHSTAARISRTEMFLRMAEIVAERGTCSRARVGAVLVRDNRVISIGYNGAPPGMPHCDHSSDSQEIGYRSSGCEIAVHAETNALLYAARSGTPTDMSELYCTHEPCLKCAQLIVTAGVETVVFLHRYRLHDGLKLLNEAGIAVAQFTMVGPTPDQDFLAMREAEITPAALEVHDYVIPPRPEDQPKPDWDNCQVCGRHASDEIHLTGEGPHVPMIHR